MTDGKPSAWQRLWRSPWTWLVLCVWCMWQFATVGHLGARHWVFLALAVVYGANFFWKADARWGKP